MRIYCVWTRIVASIPPLPRLRYCPKLSPLSLLSFLLVASLKKKGSSLFSFWKYRCSFVRRIGIITDFRLLLSLSLSCSSPVSLIFLARVGQTFSLSLSSVEFVKATIRRMRSPRSWRELTRLSLCFVCLSFEDGSGSRKEKFVSSRISRRGREER